jgi:hypothetical protein
MDQQLQTDRSSEPVALGIDATDVFSRAEPYHSLTSEDHLWANAAGARSHGPPAWMRTVPEANTDHPAVAQLSLHRANRHLGSRHDADEVSAMSRHGHGHNGACPSNAGGSIRGFDLSVQRACEIVTACPRQTRG